MKNINDIAFIIQARLSSQRVPKKMIRNFGNSNLFEIGLQKLVNSTVAPNSNIYASVCDDELVKIAEKYPINIHKRSKESAIGEEDLCTIFDWHDKLDFKYYVMLSACTPLLEQETIDSFFSTFISTDSDGLFAVVKNRSFVWNSNHEMISKFPDAKMNTKHIEPVYLPAHCLYAGKMDRIKNGVHMGTFRELNDPELYIIEGEKECLDIDYEWQFIAAEALYNHQNHPHKITP